MSTARRRFLAGPTKRINVDRAALQRNPAERPSEPILVVRVEDDKFFGWQAEIAGPSRVVYQPLYPLRDDGSSCWIETEAEVVLE